MIKNQLFTLAILLCATLMGCGNDNKEIETKLNEEVMVVHNEVMPKMGEASRLKRQLTTFKQTLPDDSVALKVNLIKTIMELSKSEDMMSDWMANYKYPNPTAKHEDLVIYLIAQKDSIKQVSDAMYMSLAIAKGFLKDMPDSIKGVEKK